MSIIQSIRDKGAKFIVFVIGLALVSFILMDYFSGKGRSAMNTRGGSVGSVNGTKIGFESFSKKVDQLEEQMKASGYPAGAALRSQAIEQAWNMETGIILLGDEFDKLGIQVGKKELGDILYGADAPQDLKSQFTDEKGVFNAVAAKQAIDKMLKAKAKTPEERLRKEQFATYLEQLEMQRKELKYTSLLSNSINYARWFVEKTNADNSQLAKVSFVKDAYTSIPDSTVKITDKDVQDYINKHKEDFKQQESRSIDYVTFSASPSAADSLATRNNLLNKKTEFDTTHNLEQYLAGENVNNYYNGYISGEVIQIAAKDSIFKIPVGSIYGPYLDGGSYVMARLEGIKQMPDTVKVRHILVSTTQRDPQSGQMYNVRDTTEAKRLIDSIQTAIRNGSNFDSLVVKLSEDQGSKEKGGVYDKVPSGQMTPPFNDFIFLNPVGTKGVVKTEFGYHYVEILSQKGSHPAYKIAYLPMEITASQETDNNALNMANQFAGDSRDQKAFDENFQKTLKPKGYLKGQATNITPISSEIRGVGMNRMLVKDIYNAKLGQVLKPERVDNNYVVVAVTEVLKEGTIATTTARPYVENALRNKKKAELFRQKLGKFSTLEAASATLGQPIMVQDSIRMTGRGNVTAMGYEPLVYGAIFNPANKGKVVPEMLAGINGIYVVRVESVTATAVADANVVEQRKAFAEQARRNAENPQSDSYPVSALKKAATIKDNRADKF